MNKTVFVKALSDAKLNQGYYTDAQRNRLLAARRAFFDLPDDEQAEIVAQCVRFSKTVRAHNLGPVALFEIYVATSQMAARRS
jgi:hypothetical protein